jgi:hypothetical protein
MTVKQLAAPEALPAVFTREVVGMATLVLPQVRAARERTFAYLTMERFVAAVRQYVRLELVGPIELFGAPLKAHIKATHLE